MQAVSMSPGDRQALRATTENAVETTASIKVKRES